MRKNQCKKQIYVIFKITFILYLSVIIFSCFSKQEMKTVIDTPVVKGMNSADANMERGIDNVIKKKN